MDFMDHGTAYAQYPLNSAAQEIRLLHLQPGEYTDEIQCELSVSTVGPGHDTYDALSYTWGDYDKEHSIWLQGNRHRITDNLYNALRQLRRRKDGCVLWIDALCINQDDLLERGEQVALMEAIYTAAEKVLVWLGDADADDDIQDVEKHKWSASCQSKFDAATRNTVPSWWQRAWTVQEYVLARNQPQLRFGDCVHSVEEFIEYYAATAQMQAMPFGNVVSAISLNEVRRKEHAAGSPKPRMVFLLSNLSKYAATDPRDYVYCLLGLMSEREARLLRPDYTLGADVVFARATHASIAGTRSLEIMKRAAWHKRTVPGLPSWAVDLTSGAWGWPGSWPDYDEPQPFWPGESVPVQLYECLDSTSTRLSLEVNILATVQRLLVRRVDLHDDICQPVHPLLEADPRWLNLRAQHKDWETRDSWRHHITNAGADLFDSWSPRVLQAEGFWQTESGTLHDQGFTMFETSKSFLGVAVGAFPVQSDDLIALPHGCPFPMLIRNAGSVYRFICFVHIHGIMKGELRQAEDEIDDTTTTIVLI